jgi:hypothetical protein
MVKNPPQYKPPREEYLWWVLSGNWQWVAKLPPRVEFSAFYEELLINPPQKNDG